MGFRHLSKQQCSSYDENKRFLSHCYTSKKEFAREYKRLYCTKAKSEPLYLLILADIENAIAEGNNDRLQKLSNLIDYISEIEDKNTLQVYYNNGNNPIKSNNLVILACKHNKDKILKYLFSSDSKILNNLSIDIGRDRILPEDEDETHHNAFYYAIRSGNIELLDTLIDKWPGDYFVARSKGLDVVLSRAYEELMLRNVLLVDEMSIFVENKLINLRFFSDAGTDTRKSVKNDPNNIKERITLVLDNIHLLRAEYSNKKGVDEKFLYIAKCVAQNINVLKYQMKSTYARLPWEEMEFCLVSFVLCHTKRQKFNLFYNVILNKSKILNHLINFSKKLEEEIGIIDRVDIGKLSVLPKLKREKVVATIVRNYPDFEKLYDDYQQMRDFRSLEKICNYIDLASTADPREKIGQLIILRTLQVIGEHMKNTLESPRLSNTTSELLLLSSPKKTREVITNLRNSLSHAYSLFKRIDMEESADINFFSNVQNDMKKVGYATNSIYYDKKLKAVKTLLEKILGSKDLDEIKEAADMLDNVQLGTMIFENAAAPKEHEKIEELITELKNKINDKTNYEQNLFNAIDDIINSKNSNQFRIQTDYSLQSMDFLFGNRRIDSDGITDIRTYVDDVFLNFKPKSRSESLKDVVKKVLHIYESIRFRVQDPEMHEIIRKIFCIAEFDVSKIKWIEELKSKLDTDRDGDKKKAEHDKLKEGQNYQKQLGQKLSILKDILSKNRLSDQCDEKFSSCKLDKKLQSGVEMLVLDIMSILDHSKNYLENNHLFLDDGTPLLTGKCLRNHLAHDNALIDVLLSDPSMVVILNAEKLTAENLTNNMKIGKLVKDNPIRLRDRYNQGLFTIDTQERMFSALEEGNLEDLKSCLKKGADINGRRSINSWTALHFAAKGSSLKVVKFLLDRNLNIDVKNIDNQYPLHIAASYGNYEIVKFFIEDKGLDVNCSDNQKRTSLHMAAQNGHKNVVKLLLKSNADTSVKDLNGFTPLHNAVKNNHGDIISILLKKEANVDHNTTKYGFTCLHLASKSKHLGLVQLLLENKSDVNAVAYNGWTPLHCAAKSGNQDIANALIKKGANFNVMSKQGDTPLHVAAENGNMEVVEVLLNSGADINVKSGHVNDTPLHLAAEQGHIDIVQALLRKGADANSKERNHLTPLHTSALRNDNKEVLEALIQNGADVNTKSKQGNTALHYAVQCGYEGIVDVLLKEGADINVKSSEGATPIETAVSCGHLQIAKTLLQHKDVSVNAKITNDTSLLHLAAWNGDVEVTKCLVEKGADVNFRSSENATPLHYAAESGNKEITKILIKNGASVNTRNIRGQEPIHIAAGSGKKEIVEILIQENANINAGDNDKCTLLHNAALYGHLDVVNVLLDKGAIVNAKSNQNLTPLHRAVLTDCGELVQILIDNGADIDAAADENFTPLHLAVSEGRNNAVEVLFKNGANVNARNSRDATPIELAVLNDNIRVVKTLLRNEKLNINAKDNNYYTVLHIAVQTGTLEIVKYLIEEGADINAKTIHGNTPLHLAILNGYKEIIKLLKEQGADISIRDNDNRTPEELEIAIAYRDLYGSDSSKLVDTPNSDETNKWLEQILVIRERYHGSDHPKVAEVLSKLGRAYINLGNNEKAKQLLERALKIEESHYGCDHFEIANTLVNLSIVYGRLCNHQKRKELLDRALPIQEMHYGSDHNEVATVLANLSNYYGALGDVQKQKKLLEKVLAIQKKCSSDHFSRATTLNNLGSVYVELGDHNSAKVLLDQALTIKEKLRN